MERILNYTDMLVSSRKRCRFLTTTFALLVWLFAILLFATSASAQVDAGGITGTVFDPVGAIVSGAKITVTNNGTGLTATAESTSTGTYVFDALRPGTYTLRAAASGFRTFVRENAEIHVQNTVMLADLIGSFVQGPIANIQQEFG